uniref:SFRICE_027567 n=1 Tax=Spodoptera frugiperda TaxID=7108 RepID=A0A2H1X189_SPOFR
MDNNFVFKLKDAPQLYKDFTKRYHRTFTSEYDYNQRYLNFIQTLRYINSINAQTFTQQKVLPNQFADYSDDERRDYLRKTAKRIDPELRMILRMNENPEESKEDMFRTQQTERTGYGIRTYA